VLLQHKSCVWKRSKGFCVVRTQTFMLDNLTNTLIETNLCGISAFCVVFFKLSNTKVCVLTTQNPCDRFRTQTSLECKYHNFTDNFATYCEGMLTWENKLDKPLSSLGSRWEHVTHTTLKLVTMWLIYGRTLSSSYRFMFIIFTCRQQICPPIDH
jgi:hypothetical protein